MKQRYPILLGVFALAVAVGALLVMRTRPRTVTAGVDINFLGYTNSASGARFALFNITNGDTISIERLSPTVEVQSEPNLQAPSTSPDLPWLRPAPLESGASCTIAIGVPGARPHLGAGTGRWRVHLRFERRTVSESVRDVWMGRGDTTPVRFGPFTLLGPPQYEFIKSSWVAP